MDPTTTTTTKLTTKPLNAAPNSDHPFPPASPQPMETTSGPAADASEATTGMKRSQSKRLLLGKTTTSDNGKSKESNNNNNNNNNTEAYNAFWGKLIGVPPKDGGD
ncbi:hypothetical protein QR685DRAFT_541237 [Neurospora intermedia]|uniref:Uncharacterized protein n=1 Tax=Neurospora intermedia TaxID=5142 RepID=A0ABR3DTM5_NEUIN